MTNTKSDVSTRIVAAVDMTETGDNALVEAMRLVRLLGGAELHVVYVIDTNPDTHSARKIDALAGEITRAHETVRDHVMKVCAPLADEDSFDQETVVHVRLGKPAEAIHQAAIDVDADLVVVGTHQRHGVSKLILGSVAERLIELARLPVVVAQPKDFGNLPHSAHADAAREGEGPDLMRRETLHFRPRTTHISGLV